MTEITTTRVDHTAKAFDTDLQDITRKVAEMGGLVIVFGFSVGAFIAIPFISGDMVSLFAGLLTIVFITLKLLHKISWSWWWVTSPLWISAALAITVLLLVVAGAVIAGVIGGRSPRRSLDRYSRSITRGRR